VGLEVDAFSAGAGASTFSAEADACLETVFCLLVEGVVRFFDSVAASSGFRRLVARPVCDLVMGLDEEDSVEGTSLSGPGAASATRWAY
jgi:hypothetical protein